MAKNMWISSKVTVDTLLMSEYISLELGRPHRVDGGWLDPGVFGGVECIGL